MVATLGAVTWRVSWVQKALDRNVEEESRRDNIKIILMERM
jgi:hypothetical protein